MLKCIKADEKLASQSLPSAIPNSSNTVDFYSTTPDYYSWKTEEKGSWFIQNKCEQFMEYAHEPWADLVTLATLVIRKISDIFKHQEGTIVLPAIVLMMDKKFHFFK